MNYKFKNLIVKPVKFFAAFLMIFGALLLFIAYNVAAIKNNKMTGAFASFNDDGRNDGTIVPEGEPGRLAAIEVTLPEDNGELSFLKGKRNEYFKYSVMAALTGHPEKIGKNYKDKFIEANKKLIEYAVSTSKLPLLTDEIKLRNSKELAYLLSEKIDKKAWRRLFEGMFAFPALAAAVFERGEYAAAAKIDAAYFRVNRSLLLMNYEIPNTSDFAFNYNYVKNEAVLKLYTETDAIFKDTALKNEIKNALITRAGYIGTMPDFTTALEGDAILREIFKSRLGYGQQLTLSMLNAWYGEPDRPLTDLTARLKSNKDITGIETYKILNEFYEEYKSKKTLWNEFVYMKDDFRSLLKFVNSALNIHPLSTFSYSNFNAKFKYIFECNSKMRLITLGGLARMFYADNKRWPDFEKDSSFIIDAGICLKDPADGKNFRVKNLSDGSIEYYSAGLDGIDNGGDTKEDVILNIKAPKF